MTITGAGVIRATGLAAIAARAIFAAIQPVHPADALASVTTGFWTFTIALKLAMCFLFALAVLYARRVEETGFALIAEFERVRIAERTREGLEAARKRGRVGGRPPALPPSQRAEARRMRAEEGRAMGGIAALFRVSAKTIRRA